MLILLRQHLEVEVEILERVVSLVKEALKGSVNVLQVGTGGHLRLEYLVVKGKRRIIFELGEPLFDFLLHQRCHFRSFL